LERERFVFAEKGRAERFLQAFESRTDACGVTKDFLRLIDAALLYISMKYEDTDAS
jgi:hypothetical protein